MQRTQQLQTLANIVFFLSISIILQGCQQSEAPEETNEILIEIIKNTNKKTLVNIEIANNLKEEFQIPLDIEHLMTSPYFSEYRNNIKSIISESDIKTWNRKIEIYKNGRFEFKDLDSLQFYDPNTRKVYNSVEPLSEFEKFVTFSPPFLNSTNDKALIYVEFLNNPESSSSKNSFLLILRKENGTWDEAYRKLLVITTP